MRRVGPAGMRWLLLATMALWGANLSIVKVLISAYEPLGVAAARMAVAALALSLVVRLRDRAWPQLTPRQWAALVACAALMIYLNQILFTEGIHRTTATHAALIISLNPLVSALLAAGALGDRMTLRRVAGVALGFGGVAVVILNRPGAALGRGGVGDLLVLASVFTWVSGGVLVHRLAHPDASGIDSGVVSWAMHCAGAAMLTLHVLLQPGSVVPGWSAAMPGHLVLLVLSAVLSTAFGALVWNSALVTLGVARTAVYVYWVPIFGVAFAVGLLGEPLRWWHLVGLAAVLGGTWLGTRNPA